MVVGMSREAQWASVVKLLVAIPVAAYWARSLVAAACSLRTLSTEIEFSCAWSGTYAAGKAAGSRILSKRSVSARGTVMVWPSRPSNVASGPVTGTAARACAVAMLCALRSSSLIAAVTYCCIGSGGRGARNPAVRAVVPGCVALFSMRLARFGYPMLAVVQNIGVVALSIARKECGKRHIIALCYRNHHACMVAIRQDQSMIAATRWWIAMKLM